MPWMIATLLDSRVLWFLARLLLAVVFLSSGLAKLLAWDNSVAEMQAAGLQPPRAVQPRQRRGAAGRRTVPAA
jgi:transmembrane protein